MGGDEIFNGLGCEELGWRAQAKKWTKKRNILGQPVWQMIGFSTTESSDAARGRPWNHSVLSVILVECSGY